MRKRCPKVNDVNLVTGATGNVGRAVVEQLLAAGRSVRAAGRTRDSVSRMFGERVEAVALDFTDSETWPSVFDGIRRMFVMRPPQLGKPKQQMLPALDYAYSHGVEQITTRPNVADGRPAAERRRSALPPSVRPLCNTPADAQKVPPTCQV